MLLSEGVHYRHVFFHLLIFIIFFNALMLLIGQLEGHPTCRNSFSNNYKNLNFSFVHAAHLGISPGEAAYPKVKFKFSK